MEREELIKTVTAAQNGDNEAINNLFNEYYNDVYYFALKTVKDDDLAGDITQETFVEIINTLGNLNEPAAFVKWMKQITYHQCTRYFKKKKDVIVDEDEDGNTVFDTVKEDKSEFIPDEALDEKDFRKTILNIIDELTEEQRSATMMYYFDELSVSQIAEIQGVSTGTVKSRLNYARKAIKASVDEYEKKNGVKLHAAIPFFPLFKWLLDTSDKTMPIGAAKTVAEGVAAATGTTVTVANTAAVAGSVATGAVTAEAITSTAVTGGFVAKIVALPLAIKITSVAVAAAIVIGGTTTAVLLNNKKDDLNPTVALQNDSGTSHNGSSLTDNNSDGDSSVVGSSDVSNTSATGSSSKDENSNTSSDGSGNSTMADSKTNTSGSTNATQPNIKTPTNSGTGWNIPSGGTYKTADGKVYNAGEALPGGYECKQDDTFTTTDYTYSFESNGWYTNVNDNQKVSYGDILSYIAGKPVISITCAFVQNLNLEVAPTIPDTVKDMMGAFQGCYNLKSVVIPAGVTDISMAFTFCDNLTSITINSNPKSYDEWFSTPSPVKTKEVTLTGSSSMLQTLAKVANDAGEKVVVR